jgi:signal transduction histidine kinase
MFGRYKAGNLGKPASNAPEALVPAIILLVGGITFSSLAAYYVKLTNARMGEAWLHDHASQIERVLSTRIEDYSDALIHTRALIDANGSFDPIVLRKYLTDVQLLDKYPGMRGIAFEPLIQAKDLDSFIMKARKINSGFQIWPPHKAERYLPVTFYEPDTAENRRVIGFDVNLWADRQEAIEKAIFTNRPAATGKVILVRGLENRESTGFIIFLPVFKPGAPIATPEQRSKAVIGMLDTVFYIHSFIGAVLGDSAPNSDISFDVYDGASPEPDSLLFNLHPGMDPSNGLRRFDHIKVGGRPWMLDFYAGPGFGNFWSRQGHWIVLIGGALISVLFFMALLAALRREELEKELVAQVRTALNARDEFISIAAHELRTPLTSLKLQLEMGRRYGNKDPVKSLARITQMGQQQIRRLTDLINELLDVTCIQTGNLRIHPQSTDLNSIVRDLADHFRNTEYGLAEKLEVQESREPVLADVDPSRLYQAVQNLLSNASKFSNGKPIRIRVEKTVDAGVIHVSDFGIGFPADRQDRIFLRFARDEESSDSVGGLGLGLYIAKKIVDAHCGSIRVKSSPGMGSTFSIELPFGKRETLGPAKTGTC